MAKTHRPAEDPAAAGLVALEHVGGRLDDVPERAIGAFVVDTACVVRAIFYQHAEADESAELIGQVSLQDHLAGRLGLVETWFATVDYPESQREPARSPEQQLPHLVDVQRRVLSPN